MQVIQVNWTEEYVKESAQAVRKSNETEHWKKTDAAC